MHLPYEHILKSVTCTLIFKREKKFEQTRTIEHELENVSS